MRIDPRILETLCCPVTREPVGPMTGTEVGRLNAALAQGRVRYTGGVPVGEALESGLSTADGASVYRILDGVPVLLPELRILNSPPDQSPAEAAPTTDTGGLARLWDAWSEKWGTFVPPARPNAEDVGGFETLIGDVCAEEHLIAPRALLLGVTSEIATMRWPAGTRLLALDFSEAMIRKIWPWGSAPGATVARGNWKAMPVLDAAYDIVIGDGVLLWQQYPDDVIALATEVRRVLKDTGAFVMRLMAKPERDEPLDAVFDSLRRGRIANSAMLHLRIGMALHRDLRSGVRLGDVYDAWHANVPDEDVLLPSLGWPPEMVRTFEVYRGSETTVAYPTAAEVSDLLSRDFRRTACLFHEYDERGMFPTVVLRPTP